MITLAILVWICVGLIALLVAGLVFAIVQIRRAHRRLDEIAPDVRGLAQRLQDADAAETLSAILAQVQQLYDRVDELQVQINDIDRLTGRAVRRVGLVRYDAHDSIRGELSFALCLLDGRDNGLMLTSIYDMESCRVFVRGILHGKAQHELMPEERQALRQAMREQ